MLNPYGKLLWEHESFLWLFLSLSLSMWYGVTTLDGNYQSDLCYDLRLRVQLFDCFLCRLWPRWFDCVFCMIFGCNLALCPSDCGGYHKYVDCGRGYFWGVSGLMLSGLLEICIGVLWFSIFYLFFIQYLPLQNLFLFKSIFKPNLLITITPIHWLCVSWDCPLGNVLKLRVSPHCCTATMWTITNCDWLLITIQIPEIRRRRPWRISTGTAWEV